LGFVLDLQHGIFQVPAKRVEALKRLIDTIIDNHFTVSARCLSHLSGSLVSMGLALGPVVRLWTRSIYRDICQANYWDKPFLVSQDSQSEVLFWRENFDNSGFPIWSPSPKVEVLTYSDASGEGWGGFAVQFSDKVARGCWSSADCLKSSTFREVKAIILPALDISTSCGALTQWIVLQACRLDNWKGSVVDTATQDVKQLTRLQSPG